MLIVLKVMLRSLLDCSVQRVKLHGHEASVPPRNCTGLKLLRATDPSLVLL